MAVAGLTNFGNSLAGDAIDGKKLNYEKAAISGALGAFGAGATQKLLKGLSLDKLRLDVKSLNEISAQPAMQRFYEEMLRSNAAPAAAARLMDVVNVSWTVGLDNLFEDGQSKSNRSDDGRGNPIGIMIQLEDITVKGATIDESKFDKEVQKDQESKLRKYHLE